MGIYLKKSPFNRLTIDKLKYKQSEEKEILIQILSLIKDNLALIALFFYWAGYIYLNNYFDNFGIAIEKYLNLNDLIYIGLSKVILLILVTFLFIISIGILSYFVSWVIKKTFLKEYFLNLTLLKIGVNLYIIILIITYLVFPRYKYLPSVGLVFILFIFEYQKSGKLFNTQIVLKLLLVLIFLYQIISSLGRYDSNNIKLYSQENDICISLDNIELEVNGKDLKLIGETSSNVFLYRPKDCTTIVLKRDDIKQIAIKSKDFEYLMPNIIEDTRFLEKEH